MNGRPYSFSGRIVRSVGGLWQSLGLEWSHFQPYLKPRLHDGAPTEAFIRPLKSISQPWLVVAQDIRLLNGGACGNQAWAAFQARYSAALACQYSRSFSPISRMTRHGLPTATE